VASRDNCSPTRSSRSATSSHRDAAISRASGSTSIVYPPPAPFTARSSPSTPDDPHPATRPRSPPHHQKSTPRPGNTPPGPRPTTPRNPPPRPPTPPRTAPPPPRPASPRPPTALTRPQISTNTVQPSAQPLQNAQTRRRHHRNHRPNPRITRTDSHPRRGGRPDPTSRAPTTPPQDVPNCPETRNSTNPAHTGSPRTLRQQTKSKNDNTCQ
ncbi:MAG: hypothetical protein QG608_337, partial [Actinomycetota bacterium]|nr:hypothetical protein [Actinomycetota bacterium]